MTFVASRGAALWVLVFLSMGCTGGGRASLYGGGAVSDWSDPGLKALSDELSTLPFREEVWRNKLSHDEIKAITKGSEFLYIETPRNRVIAIDRFTGEVRWIYDVDTHRPLDYAPVEAGGVPDEIRQREAELRTEKRKLDDIVKTKGPGKEAQEQQKKVDQVREFLRQAQSGDNVYLLSQGTLFCLVRTTGTLLWSRQLALEFAPGGPPYAIRGDIFIPGANLARVWRLSAPNKGASVTFYRSSIGTHDNQITNRPVYEEPSVYFVSHDGAIYSYPSQGGEWKWRYQTGDEVRADPVIHKYRRTFKDATGKERVFDRTFLFVGGFDYAFYALDATNGKLEWKYETAGQIKTPVVVKGDTVYVKTEGGALFALDIAPMERTTEGQIVAPPVTEDWPWKRLGNRRWMLPLGERFLVKGRDHVYVLGPNNEIFRVNEMSGEVIGRYPLRHFQHVVTNPTDDILYVAHPSGYLYALREAKD